MSILLIHNTAEASCEIKRELVVSEKSIALCYSKKQELYLSPECDEIKKCFFSKDIDLTIYANQSPGFSLCYQLNGEPFFGTIKNQLVKVPMCKLREQYIDQENLMESYFKMGKRS